MTRALSRRAVCAGAALAAAVIGVPAGAARGTAFRVLRLRGTVSAGDGLSLPFDETTVLESDGAVERRSTRRQIHHGNRIVEITLVDTVTADITPDVVLAQWTSAGIEGFGDAFAHGPLQWRGEGTVTGWMTEPNCHSRESGNPFC